MSSQDIHSQIPLSMDDGGQLNWTWLMALLFGKGELVNNEISLDWTQQTQLISTQVRLSSCSSVAAVTVIDLWYLDSVYVNQITIQAWWTDFMTILLTSSVIENCSIGHWKIITFQRPDPTSGYQEDI